MTDQHDNGLQPHEAPATPVPPAAAPSQAAIIQAALDHLAHPTTLDLHARLSALEQAIRVMAQALLPLLTTE